MAKTLKFWIFSIAIASGVTPNAQASMNYFSRANCINNESITWDPWHSLYERISAYSVHQKNDKTSHNIYKETTNDNAAKAIHWGEPSFFVTTPEWHVYGLHMWIDEISTLYRATSSASGCGPFPDLG